MAPTKQTTTTTTTTTTRKTRKTTRENLLEKDDNDEDDDEKERSSRGADASVAEATMQRVEEVEKQQGNLGASTSSRLDESETSVELWDELEDLSPRFFHGKSPTIPDGLGLMRAPLDSSTPQTSRFALPVSAIDNVAVVAMLAYDVYIEPTSGRAFSPIRGDRGNDRSPSSTAILPTTNHLVSSTARLPPKTTMTTTKKPLGDACAQRREYERLRSAERRRKQTPEQRERERIRSQQRRARMTDEQKRAATDARSRRRAALKASKRLR